MIDMNSIKRDLKDDLKPRKIVRAAIIPQFKGIANPLKDVFGIFVRIIALMFTQAKLIDADHPANTGAIKGPGAIWQMIVDASTRLEMPFRVVNPRALALDRPAPAKGLRGLQQAILQKFSRLQVKKDKTAQLVVFYSVVGMIVLSLFSIVTAGMELAVPKSHAQNAIFSEPSSTVSSNFLAMMFPYTNAGAVGGLAQILGTMLLTYNTGILVLASLMALWSLIGMIVDSAHHGQWGGQRHSALYAPIRLVFAIGLLTPLGASMNNFNSAQVLTVLIAQAGSGLANTIWDTFLANFNTVPAYAPIAPPADLNKNLAMLYSIAECQAEAVEQANNQGTSAPSTSLNPVTNLILNGSGNVVENYTITFNATAHNDGECGSVTIPAFNSAILDEGTTPSLQSNIWVVGANGVGGFDQLYNAILADASVNQTAQEVVNESGSDSYAVPTPNFSGLMQTYLSNLQAVQGQIQYEYELSPAGNPNTVSQNLITQGQNWGWVSAGSSFLNFASMASKLISAENLNFDVTPPAFQLSATPSQENGLIKGTEDWLECNGLFGWWAPYYCSNPGKKVHTAVMVMNEGVQAAEAQAGYSEITANGNDVSNSGTGSSLISHLNGYGFGAIQSMITGQGAVGPYATATSNGFGEPMLRLISLGDIIIGVDAIAMGGVAVFGGAPFASGAKDVLLPILFYMFGLGVTLSVLIPLLPAIRFFFGILTWLLTIFEALLALPVVALWHLRSEGEGLLAHGQQGYLLILQMMLRPSLMIFGLVGAVLVFDTVSNLIYVSTVGVWWNLPGMTLFTGFGEALSFFGFLGVWVAFNYMVANLCFGLINTIPDRILQWIGSSGIGAVGGDLEGIEGAAQGAMGAARGGYGALAIEGGRRAMLARQNAGGGGGENTATISSSTNSSTSGSPGPVPAIGGGGAGGGTGTGEGSGTGNSASSDSNVPSDNAGSGATTSPLGFERDAATVAGIATANKFLGGGGQLGTGMSATGMERNASTLAGIGAANQFLTAGGQLGTGGGGPALPSGMAGHIPLTELGASTATGGKPISGSSNFDAVGGDMSGNGPGAAGPSQYDRDRGVAASEGAADAQAAAGEEEAEVARDEAGLETEANADQNSLQQQSATAQQDMDTKRNQEMQAISSDLAENRKKQAALDAESDSHAWAASVAAAAGIKSPIGQSVFAQRKAKNDMDELKEKEAVLKGRLKKLTNDVGADKSQIDQSEQKAEQNIENAADKAKAAVSQPQKSQYDLDREAAAAGPAKSRYELDREAAESGEDE